MSLQLGKRIAKWTILLSSLDYIILAANFIFSLIIIANLQPANYGLFSISSATYLVFSSVLQSFFVSPFIRAISMNLGINNREKASLIFGHAILVSFLSSTIFMILHFELAPLFASLVFGFPDITVYMQILSLNIVSLVMTGLFRGFLLSTKSYKKLAVSRLMDSILYIVGISSMTLFFGWTILSIVIGTDLYLLISSLVSASLAIAEANKRKLSISLLISRSLFIETFSLGKYFALGDSLYYIFLRWDLFVISTFLHNPTLIGYYSFVKSLILRVRIVFTKINALLYPIFSEQYAISSSNTVVNKLLKAGLMVSIAIGLPITLFFSIFSREGILLFSLFISKLYSYISASSLLSIFSLLLFSYAISAWSVSYFNGLGEVDKLVKANFILLVSALFLMPPLSFYFGILGAAVAYVTSNYLATLFWIIKVLERIHVNIKKIIYLSILTVLSSAIVRILYDFGYFVLAEFMKDLLYYPIMLIFSFPLYLYFTYFLLIHFNVLDERDKRIICKVFAKNKIAAKVLVILGKLKLLQCNSS